MRSRSPAASAAGTGSYEYAFSSGMKPPMASGLVVVEVAMVGRRHDRRMLLAHGFDPAFLAAPRHHDRSRCEPALQDLVPADHPLAARRDEPLDAPREE